MVSLLVPGQNGENMLSSRCVSVSWFTCVDAFVPLQSSGVTESSLAVHTDVGFLPTVDSQVSLQIP